MPVGPPTASQPAQADPIEAKNEPVINPEETQNSPEAPQQVADAQAADEEQVTDELKPESVLPNDE